MRPLPHQLQHELLNEVNEQEPGDEQDLGHGLLVKVHAGALEVLANLGKQSKSTVSKNKSPFEKFRLYFNFETQSRYFVWLCNCDPGLFLTFECKTQMGFYFLRL